VTAPTNGAVTLSAEAAAGEPVTLQVSLNNKKWTELDSDVVRTANGAVCFRAVDAAGNASKVVTYKVSNIDTVAPTTPTAKASTTKPTNADVTVTAKFSSDSTVRQYSMDGATWSTYGGGVSLSENGTIYFRGADAAGNISAIARYTISNIDKTAPDTPVVSANITAPTTKSVTVKATFGNGTAKRQYSLNGGAWKSYGGGVTLKANGTVAFRGIDAAGNVSEIATYEVTNIGSSSNHVGDNDLQKLLTSVVPVRSLAADLAFADGNDALYDGMALDYSDGAAASASSAFGLESVSLAFDNGDNGASAWRQSDLLRSSAAFYESADSETRYAKKHGMLAG
jgi:hypothetical protein